MSFFPISLLHKFKIQQINHPRNNNAVTAVKEVRKPLYGVLPEHKLKVNGNSRQTSQTSSCCCLFVKPVVFPDSQEDEGIYRHSAWERTETPRSLLRLCSKARLPGGMPGPASASLYALGRFLAILPCHPMSDIRQNQTRCLIRCLYFNSVIGNLGYFPSLKTHPMESPCQYIRKQQQAVLLNIQSSVKTPRDLYTWKIIW